MLNSKLPEFKSQEFGLCVNFRLSKYVFLLRPRVIFQLALYKKQNNPVERSQRVGGLLFFSPFFCYLGLKRTTSPLIGVHNTVEFTESYHHIFTKIP